MKRFILAVMLLSLVQCTTKQSDKPSTPLPPPTNTTDPVQPVPLEPEVAVSALPSDLKVEALAEKQMISVNVGPVVNQIQQLVAASLPHLAFIPGIDQISATIPAMVPQVFGKMGREIVRDMVPHHWRSLLDMADLSPPGSTSPTWRASPGATPPWCGSLRRAPSSRPGCRAAIWASSARPPGAAGCLLPGT